MIYQLHLYGHLKFENSQHLASYRQFNTAYFIHMLCSYMLESNSEVDFVSHRLDPTEKSAHKVYKRNSDEYGLIDPRFDYMVLKNTITGRFSVLDFKDGPSSAQVLQTEPGFSGALISMYEPGWVDENFNHPELVEPYLFFDQMPNLTQQMALEVSQIHETASDNRLFMAATLGTEDFYSIKTSDGRVVGRRHLARVLAERWPDEVLIWDRDQKLPREQYWLQAAQHRWNLFLPGHPWCYREHEHWRLGLATISLNLWHPLKIALNPGEHYVSVQVPQSERDYTGCSLNPEAHAEQVIQTFRRVRDDERLRKRIAQSAQQRMERANVRAVAAETLSKLIAMTH